MQMYYTEIRVTPLKCNSNCTLVEGAIVSCWVESHDSQSALSIATFHIIRYDWKIENVELGPIVVYRNDFTGRQLGRENFDKAQEDGFALVFSAWARDGRSEGELKQKPTWIFDPAKYLDAFKKLQRRGRCLHFEAGVRCNHTIAAHSIQKSGVLAQVACDGHVCKLTAEFGIMKKTKGKVACSKVGISKASTFMGFCAKHDNALFEPIDTCPLLPTKQQVLLYAYRSICRELLVKENVLNVLEAQINDAGEMNTNLDFLLASKKGTVFGLSNLLKHKTIYDNRLKTASYEGVHYVLFISTQSPKIVFSGTFFPDFDFLGRELQDLSNHNKPLELINFCFAPLESGWGFLFSWLQSNSNICIDFMQSLATIMHDKQETGDPLFRLVMSTCENHAFSPEWWEHLCASKKELLIDRMSYMADTRCITPATYLMQGLEGISGWRFEKVISSM